MMHARAWAGDAGTRIATAAIVIRAAAVPARRSMRDPFIEIFGCKDTLNPGGWLVVEVGEVCLDLGDTGLRVLGVVGAEAGEDAQGELPVPAGLVVVVEGVM